MAIPVKLQVFEGPLDLLLHLIDKNKINIYDIPIAEITGQYLEYVRSMEKEDLNVCSEFLVMAADLIDIKSRMLLPAEVDEETGEEIDPRAELVEQLLEYKLYKHMAGELKERAEENKKVLFRSGSLPKEVQSYREPVDLDKLLDGLTLGHLNRTFEQVMRRREDRMDPIRSGFGTIEKEEVNLTRTRDEVSSYIRRKRNCSFKSILTAGEGKMYTVVAFLTILEMIKTGCIKVSQQEPFSEILIEAGPEDKWELFEESVASEE